MFTTQESLARDTPERLARQVDGNDYSIMLQLTIEADRAPVLHWQDKQQGYYRAIAARHVVF